MWHLLFITLTPPRQIKKMLSLMIDFCKVFGFSSHLSKIDRFRSNVTTDKYVTFFKRDLFTIKNLCSCYTHNSQSDFERVKYCASEMGNGIFGTNERCKSGKYGRLDWSNLYKGMNIKQRPLTCT